MFHLLKEYQGTTQHCIIFNLFGSLSNIYQANPKTYKILLIRLLEPNLSYQNIADRLNTSKQLIAYHLQKAKDLLPELNLAFLVDQRKFPKNRKSA